MEIKTIVATMGLTPWRHTSYLVQRQQTQRTPSWGSDTFNQTVLASSCSGMSFFHLEGAHGLSTSSHSQKTKRSEKTWTFQP